MKDLYEVATILQKNEIYPAINEWSGTPKVWLSGKFVAVEINPKYLFSTVVFFTSTFVTITITELENGNFMVKASKLTEKVKRELSN